MPPLEDVAVGVRHVRVGEVLLQLVELDLLVLFFILAPSKPLSDTLRCFLGGSVRPISLSTCAFAAAVAAADVGAAARLAALS